MSSPALLLVRLQGEVETANGGRMDYRYGSHTVYEIEYHVVWVTK